MPARSMPHRLPAPGSASPPPGASPPGAGSPPARQPGHDAPFIPGGLRDGDGAGGLPDLGDVSDLSGLAGQGDPAIPAIPVSAGAMIFDRSGRLLILKPTYKSGWTIPGGVMEADGETPWEACRREVREECGLDIQSGRLACVDFRRPRPARPAGSGKRAKPGNPGGVRFLFDCGRLDDVSLAAVVLQPEEISEHRLARPAAALKLLRKPIRRRVAAALQGGPPRYLENGRPVRGAGP